MTAPWSSALTVGLLRLVTGVQVRLAAGPVPAGQAVFFANHTSHLDAAVIWASLPGPSRRCTRPVAARDYWWAGSARRFLAERVFQAVPIRRESDRAGGLANPLQPLFEALDTGSGLIVFPEGTRGSGAAVAPFKPGLYHLALRYPAIPLIPVHIDNLNRILPKGEVLPLPLVCALTFGAPLAPPAQTVPSEPEARAAFLDRARRAILELAPP